jgi:uncharacterized protein YdhG (YjbR/CyaY superfamily)
MAARYKTIDEYLATRLPEKQATLKKLRDALRTALPKAEGVISYSMPAFRKEGIVVWFAAAKNHYAIYVYPRVLSMFRKELSEYGGTKSAIHFAYDKAMPVKLITKIAKESLKQNLEKLEAKKKKLAKGPLRR